MNLNLKKVIKNLIKATGVLLLLFLVISDIRQNKEYIYKDITLMLESGLIVDVRLLAEYQDLDTNIRQLTVKKEPYEMLVKFSGFDETVKDIKLSKVILSKKSDGVVIDDINFKTEGMRESSIDESLYIAFMSNNLALDYVEYLLTVQLKIIGDTITYTTFEVPLEKDYKEYIDSDFLSCLSSV